MVQNLVQISMKQYEKYDVKLNTFCIKLIAEIFQLIKKLEEIKLKLKEEKILTIVIYTHDSVSASFAKQKRRQTGRRLYYEISNEKVRFMVKSKSVKI